MRYIICYDIANTKRRVKTSLVLEKFGIRVQESVFEATMPIAVKQRLIKLISKITTIKDTVRIYPICKDCYSKTLEIGEKKKKPFDKGYEIY